MLKQKIDGVVVGMVMGFEAEAPMVVFPGNLIDRAIPARSLVRFTPSDIGCEVALCFEDGRQDRPLIIGPIVDPARTANEADTDAKVIRDGEVVKVTAEEQLELRVGKASIVMKKDGHITIRGTYLVSHASASNRIRGGSVNLN